MTRTERILAASSFSFLIIAAVLFWTAYKDHAAGLSALNLVRLLAAGIALGLAVKGTRLRHASRD